MIPLLLILIPLIDGLFLFFNKNERSVRSWALFSSLSTLVISILGLTLLKEDKYLEYKCDWLPALGSSFSVKLDGMGQLLCLLNAVVYPLILLATWKTTYKKSNNFFCTHAAGTGRADGCIPGDGCISVLFLLGTGDHTDVFSLFTMGGEKEGYR